MDKNRAHTHTQPAAIHTVNLKYRLIQLNQSIQIYRNSFGFHANSLLSKNKGDNLQLCRCKCMRQ